MKKTTDKEKEYKSNDVLERAFVVKMFHNKELRDEHLPQTIPTIFYNTQRRLLVYLMKRIHDANKPMTIDNLLGVMYELDNSLKAFVKKHRCVPLTETEIHEAVYDVTVDSTTENFILARDAILEMSFSRFVEEAINDIQYWNSYGFQSYQPNIIAKCKGIVKVRDIIYNRMIENHRDQLLEMMDLVNSDNEYISTSSQVLNSLIGGFSRGYVASIIAKSSHCKSSWADFNCVHTILSGKVFPISIISPEESAATRWRRVVAMIMKLPTSGMRQKNVKITSAHVAKVRELLGDKLHIYDNVFKYKDIIDLQASLKDTQMIVVDHLQSIEYPGAGGHLHNMIGNIPGMIDAQKRIAKVRHISIINLSQVNDKEIQRSDRLLKAPRYWDAYGSSVLYQASREFLALWYPYKDYEDNPSVSYGTNPPSISDIRISIEKSSFSRIGKVELSFNPDFNLFSDKNKKALDRLDYNAPEEKTISQQLELL
uniref:Putative helicase n=1 Tax=viral metagenome TaxID=1070528 RepID=A0A6H1ZLB7_9ZZZZ